MKIEVPDLQSDERGVSPVIGVILMVAITVILAAVIGAFVLDLGSQLGSTGPQTQLAVSDNSDALGQTSDTLVTVEHKGGDDLKASELKVIVSGGPSEVTLDPATETGDTLGASVSGTFTVGETFTISENSNYIDSQTTLTVKVIHKPSNSVITSSKVEVS